MSISINLIQRKDKLNQNNTAPIHLRLTHKSKNRYVSTGVTLPIDVWSTENQSINPDYPEATELQLKINAVRIEYEKKVKRLEALDVEVNFDTLLGTRAKMINCTLQDYFQKVIDGLESMGKFGSASKHRTTLSLINKFHAGGIRFDEIDLSFLRNFERFLQNRQNNGNSIATKFSLIKAIYNKAIAEDVFIPKSNPFTKFKVGSLWTKTRKRSITKEDIQKLITLEIPDDYRSNYKSLARDIFLFSYFTMGINFGDIAHLKHSNIRNGRIYYSRRKTQKMLTCQLNPLATEIIDKYSSPFYDDEDYIFPILDPRVHKTAKQQFNRVHKSLAKINDALHIIGKELGLPFPLTTYVARHTYATVLKRSGVNIAIISESLGHSDLATTQIYLDSFENSQIDEAMKNLL